MIDAEISEQSLRQGGWGSSIFRDFPDPTIQPFIREPSQAAPACGPLRDGPDGVPYDVTREALSGACVSCLSCLLPMHSGQAAPLILAIFRYCVCLLDFSNAVQTKRGTDSVSSHRRNSIPSARP